MGQLSIADVGIEYTLRDGERFRAVDGVSLEVPEGSLTALIGPSGCGKSSLLAAVGGLLPYVEGNISVDGERVVGPTRGRVVVFQQPALLPWRSALANVMYPLELQKVPRGERRERAKRALELVDLGDALDLYPNQLSGGMQQRVNIARGFVQEPTLLLLDEPFASVDAQTREELGFELLRLWDIKKVTAILVTHQIDEAVLLADRACVMSSGPAAHVVDDFTIELPRPRSRESRKDPRFQECAARIESSLDRGRVSRSARVAGYPNTSSNKIN